MSGYFSLVAFAAAMSIASIAQAGEVSARCGKVVTYAPDAVLCLERVSVGFSSAGPSTAYEMRISTPRSACSDTSFIVYNDRPAYRRDAPAAIASTYRLGPGQAQNVTLGAGFAAGGNSVQIGAILYEGDCRGRAAGTWRASVAILPVTS